MFKIIKQTRIMEADTISKNGRNLKSQMSKGIMFCLLFLIVFFSSGCTDEETIEIGPRNTDNATIVIDPIIFFDSEGGTHDVKIECDIALTVSDALLPKLITVTKTGNIEEQIFHLTASKNESNEIRACHVICLGGKYAAKTAMHATAFISVLQYGQENDEIIE